MKKISYLVGLGFFILTSLWQLAPVQAQNLIKPVRVPALQITNLSQYKGLYISVYYALGKKSFIGLGAQEERVEITRLTSGKVADYRLSEDSLLLPERQIKRQMDGLNMAYNLIVLVIHQDPNFSWLNVQSDLQLSYPENETPTNNHDAVAISYLTKSQVDQMLANANNVEPLNFAFGSNP